MAYVYDANGNTLSKTKAGITTEFKYDLRNQLSEVLQGPSVLGRYGYDYENLRILKIGDDGIRRYTYDQLSVITEANETSTTVSKYDYGLDQLVSLDATSEGRSFFHLDFLGSTANLTDSVGATRQSILYDAWGNERDRVGVSTNKFTFTGHEKDDETGLIYAKARFYDPDIGRFLNQDSYLGDAANAPSLHRYMYGYANPTRFVDPSGFTNEDRYEMLLAAALKRYFDSGTTNTTALGEAGEIILEQALAGGGYTLVKGPGTLPSQHNADIIAFDPDKGEFLFLDNKIQTGKETISGAPNLKDSDRRLRSVDVARENVQKLVQRGDISAKASERMLAELDEISLELAKKPVKGEVIQKSRAQWLVATESPDGITNMARRVSPRLARKGVRLAQLKKNGELGFKKLEIKNLEDSLDGVRGTKKLLGEVAKAAPGLGLAVSAVMASSRVEAAAEEDMAFVTMMTLLNADTQGREHDAVQRELAVIAGEESLGEAMGLGGVAVGSLCGPWCAVGGGFVGGAVGSSLGGYLAGRQFDEHNKMTEEEMDAFMRGLER